MEANEFYGKHYTDNIISKACDILDKDKSRHLTLFELDKICNQLTNEI